MRPGLVVLSALCASGCTAGARLAEYPRREIDRPYTLPKGVASWSTPTVGGAGYSSEGVDGILPIPYPLLWQLALTDDLNVLFVPVPLALAWQVLDGPRVRVGALFVAGLGYSNDRGVLLVPDVDLRVRLKLARDVALDLGMDGALQVAAELPKVDSGSASGFVGPLLQTSDEVWLEPRVSLSYERGMRSSDLIAGEVGPASERESLGVGVSLRGGVLVHPQWELTWAIDFLRAENAVAPDRTRATGTLTVIHYW